MIGKAAAECPAAVIVDLSDLEKAVDDQLALFATAAHQAHATWGAPVLFCAARPEIRDDLTAFRNFVALHDRHEQAALAVHAYVPRWVRQRFAPEPADIAEARSLVGEACLRWGLVHLKENARLIASELTSNAIRHAGTDYDLLITYTGRFLRIAVRDGSSAMPALREGSSPVTSGNGLQLVTAMATHWNARKVPGGKIVWALVRAHSW